MKPWLNPTGAKFNSQFPLKKKLLDAIVNYMKIGMQDIQGGFSFNYYKRIKCNSCFRTIAKENILLLSLPHDTKLTQQ